MYKSIHFISAAAALFGLSEWAWAADPPAAGVPATHHAATAEGTKSAQTDDELIASAMKAAPKKVAEKATIVTPDPKGGMRTLRKGTNGFTCMPDNPETPGPDPMCWDKNAGEWLDAYLGHKTPPAGKVGLMYMVAGGTDASNTDPYAAKPTTANHWIKTGPHIMIVGADASFYDTYPKSADPDTKSPYVMWAGTPYQHLMAPIN
ncbi:MAG: hypothetical protein M3N91_18420 [Pseudomonadota bacterium]|nr:hypothetical protein [Pseudomonadota bacterium]